MRKLILYFAALLLLATSCVPQADYDKLKKELKETKLLLDEAINGADKLCAKINYEYSVKNYSATKFNIAKLKEKHPESPKNKEFETLLLKIEKEVKAEVKRKEAEEKERIRKANYNNTGIWSVLTYVDDFGEPTSQRYIRTVISGTFCNSATQNSELAAKLLIDNYNDMSIMLYEYASNNPVKAYSEESYKILIKDENGKRLESWATNTSDRLQLREDFSKELHYSLKKGGSLKFKIIEYDTPINTYSFTIDKADWYENAYRRLKEK